MKICILCTKYLENVSLNFRKMLLYFFPENITCIENIYSEQNISLVKRDDFFYIIIGAQFFKNLVPKLKNKKFIIYQLEQLDKIKLDPQLISMSKGIIDYTEINRKIYKDFQILYPPFSSYIFSVITEKEKDIDILFYGCLNPRRNNILNYVRHEFPNLNVKILNNKRGEELYDFIKKSKIVLNISFYKPAIFEICRINEIIPFGTFIISELNLIDEYTKTLYEKKIFFVENIESNLKQLSNIILHILSLDQKQDYSDIINEINLRNKNIMYNILYNPGK